MSTDTVRRETQKRFAEGFVSGSEPLFPIQYENHPFMRPDGAPWGRFLMREGQRANATVGNDLKRTPGFVMVQFFLPEDTGTKPAADAADKMAEIFDDTTITGTWGAIQFFSVGKQNVGKTDDGFYQVNISVEFRFDEAV
jgi:Bacteriophage related domain of unknown function